jgi:uncharacterized membrane protein
MNGNDAAINVLFGTALLIVAIASYFLPTIIASNRGHQSTNAIAILNLLLGWTAIGWIFALVWACTHVHERFDAKCPFCLAAIPSAATRCSHCTSPLAQPSASLRGRRARSRW